MHYYIRRYRNGIWKIRRWWPIVFLPSVIYLMIAAAAPDEFSVSQMLSAQKTAPIALSRTPVDIMTMGELASNPAGLYLDDFAIMDLIKQLGQTAHGQKEDYSSRDLRELVENGMSLKISDDSHVLLSYYGNDLEMGKTLVNYYTQRLVNRSKDGLARKMRGLSRTTSGPESKGPLSVQPARQDASGVEPSLSNSQPVTLEGNIIIQKHRFLWRSDRLLPAATALAVSLLLMFLAAGFVEWADPTFTSERQISRYLDLRVVGVIPDLGPLVRRMKST